MIVILTDFGHSEYVGVMKGVIYSIAADAKIVDLCHNISPQSIIEASWVLKNNYKYLVQAGGGRKVEWHTILITTPPRKQSYS